MDLRCRSGGAPPASAGKSYRGKVELPDGGSLELGGIVWSDADPRALINDRVVGVGAYVQGYTIERLILGKTSAFNDVANWHYADLPAVLAPTIRAHTFVVADCPELEVALEAATNPTALTFIEVKFELMDTPRGMPVFGKMAREYDYGHWALQR